MSKEIDFTILYDGELLASHSMDVKELAPSLIDFADFLEESFKELYGGDKNLKVQFKANRKGSLGVELLVVTDLIETVTTFFNSGEVSALLNFLEIVGIVTGGSAGLIKTVKWLRSRSVKRIINRAEGPDVDIETEGGEKIEVRREVPKLLKSISIREHLFGFIKPLKKEGVDNIKFEPNEGKEGEIIDKNDADYFEVPDLEDEELVEETKKAAFTINSLSFKEDNKWRVSDGSNNYLVTISDEEFLDDVQNNRIAFAKDDVLVVKLKTRQLKTVNGLRTEHEVLEVLDYQSSTPQLNFSFDNE